jgi:acyl-coenzyme A thioesterase PaaI-like protein
VPADTVSLTKQFLGQAKQGDVLIAVGKHIAGGRTIAYGTAEVTTEDGKPVARGDATFRILSLK